MTRHARFLPRRSGCGVLVMTCIVTCMLLLANRILLGSLYIALVPAHWDYAKLHSIILFVGPVILILPQWWALDAILASIARLLARNKRQEPRP